MEPLDQETASVVIKNLGERGFINWLTPENRRGAILTHGFHGPDEIQRLKSLHSGGVSVSDLASPVATPPDRVGRLEAQLSEAMTAIAALRAEVEQLRGQVTSLQEALGVPS